MSADHHRGFAITSRGGGVELGLVDDSVYIAVVDSLVMRGRRFARPLRDIRTAEYGGGVIRFHYRRKREPAFEDVSSRRGNALASFRPEDARRFVAALDSAIATLHAGP